MCDEPARQRKEIIVEVAVVVRMMEMRLLGLRCVAHIAPRKGRKEDGRKKVSEIRATYDLRSVVPCHRSIVCRHNGLQRKRTAP